MGRVFRPKDVLKSKRVLEEALKDLNPTLAEDAIRLLEAWKGEDSMRELERILGVKKAQTIFKRLDLEG